MKKVFFILGTICFALIPYAQGQTKTKPKPGKAVVQPKPVAAPLPPYTIEEFSSTTGNKCAVLKSFGIVANNRDNWSLSVGYCPIELSEKMKKFDLVQFTVYTISSDWKYADYSGVTLMADGEKLRIVDHTRSPLTRKDNLVQENIQFFISPGNFYALAKANRIDLGIGNERYQLPSVALEALRDFSTHVHPLKTREEKRNERKLDDDSD